MATAQEFLVIKRGYDGSMLFGVGHCKTMTLCGNHTPKALQTSALGAQLLGSLGLTTPNQLNTEGVQQKWLCRQKCVATMND